LIGCGSKSEETINTGEKSEMLSDIPPNNIRIAETKYYKCIILDCAMVQFIDETGAKILMEIIQDYKNEDVKFLLANCNSNMLVLFVLPFFQLKNNKFSNDFKKSVCIFLIK
jgi:hypothetical protein